MLSLLAILGALAMLAILPGSARSAQIATQWRGAQVHSTLLTETSQEMKEDLDSAKAAGANVVRVDIAWETLESNGPTPNPSYSARLDQFMAYANQLGIKVIPILFSTPCWASSAPASLKQGCKGDWWNRGVAWYPPTNDQDFANFARYITSTYGADLAAVEIWNEPDTSGFWTSTNPAADYANLLKAAYPAAKAGDSSVPVLAGAMAGSDLPFLQALYGDGIQGYYDGISVHPYCGANPPSWAGGDVRYEFQAGLTALHALQLQHGDHTSLWVTEFGWDTLNNTPANQASFIQQGYQILAGMPYVQAGVVYELHDNIGGDPASNESHFGLMNQDYTPKPAYAAFRAVMTAPAAPVPTQPTTAAVANAPESTVSFKAAPDSTVAVYNGKALIQTATANATGAVTLNVPHPPTDGQRSLRAIDTDVYGNVGPASAAVGATAVTASVAGRLALRVSRRRASVLPVTCSVSRVTISGCQIIVYAHGRKVASGRISMHSGRPKAAVKIRVRSRSPWYTRALRGRLILVFKASATDSTGHRLRVTKSARLVR